MKHKHCFVVFHRGNHLDESIARVASNRHEHHVRKRICHTLYEYARIAPGAFHVLNLKLRMPHRDTTMNFYFLKHRRYPFEFRLS